MSDNTDTCQPGSIRHLNIAEKSRFRQRAPGYPLLLPLNRREIRSTDQLYWGSKLRSPGLSLQTPFSLIIVFGRVWLKR